MQLNILYEDNHLLIVNKQPGQLVQGDKTGDTCLQDIAKAYIKKKYNKPGDVFLGVCHRLDRPTSGAVIFARTSKALERVNNLLKFRKIKKEYWAVVEGLSGAHDGKLIDYLIKDERRNKSKVVLEDHPGAKKAVLKYQVLYELKKYYLLAVELETGRHHQIRVQLSNQKMPIKGDVKYGARRANKDRSIHLHARLLEFIHPVKKEKMTILADPPLKDIVWQTVMEG